MVTDTRKKLILYEETKPLFLIRKSARKYFPSFPGKQEVAEGEIFCGGQPEEVVWSLVFLDCEKSVKGFLWVADNQSN